MADPKHVFFGLSGSGSIWSVDDAWFEGHNPQGNSAASIETEISFDCNHDYQKLLDAISVREDSSEDMGAVALENELEYLKVLAQLCKENRLCLHLCNFEYFEENYRSRINKEKTAILLDIKYDDFQRTDKESPVIDEQYQAENYGYILLADLLKGERTRADIFFVTSRGELAHDIRSKHKTVPLWWPLRTIPYISKSSGLTTEDVSLEDELAAFIKYFVQGINKDPRREFSNALQRAHTQGFSHPDPDIETSVPHDFLLREEFVLNGGLESECKSFKALYKTDKLSAGAPRRDLLTRIFQSHLEHATVKVQTESGIFRLPVEPGMLFILCLLDLHKALELDEEIISLNLKSGELGGIAELFIPLRDSDEFKSAFFTRESEDGAVNALRRLLGCNVKVFENFVNANSETSDLIEDWKRWRMTPSGNYYKMLMEPKFNDTGLVITWEYLNSPPDIDL